MLRIPFCFFSDLCLFSCHFLQGYWLLACVFLSTHGFIRSSSLGITYCACCDTGFKYSHDLNYGWKPFRSMAIAESLVFTSGSVVLGWNSELCAHSTVGALPLTSVPALCFHDSLLYTFQSSVILNLSCSMSQGMGSPSHVFSGASCCSNPFSEQLEKDISFSTDFRSIGCLPPPPFPSPPPHAVEGN